LSPPLSQQQLRRGKIDPHDLAAVAAVVAVVAAVAIALAATRTKLQFPNVSLRQ
jgi:hypothetical protein